MVKVELDCQFDLSEELFCKECFSLFSEDIVVFFGYLNFVFLLGKFCGRLGDLKNGNLSEGVGKD